MPASDRLEFLAHPGHRLEDHLTSVGRTAASFAEHFGSAEWGELAGLWHDLGKYQPEFQRRLAGERVSVEHSGMGAAHAAEIHPSMSMPLCFAIAGHHAGLANLIRNETGAPKSLTERIRENREALRRTRQSIPASLLDRPLPPLPDFLRAPSGNEARYRRRIELWIRFLFSALTDADYLDTEAAMAPARAASRAPGASIETLGRLLEDALGVKAAKAAPTAVNQARAMVADACLEAAAKTPGIFSLTAPTGCGKTLASMRFALHHAKRHGLRRVIGVLPYTSIIEQNAAAYREVFGESAVLEHHSNLDPEAESERAGEETTARHRLASENWDAPIIVTTTVQFFESLFSNRSSRCRKLHNIAKSVVILDEVQSLPPGFLLTIVDGLKSLAEEYGCTILLSTATPPALAARSGFPEGLAPVTEIVPDANELAATLRRVEYHWPTDEGQTGWEELAGRMIAHPQVLAVVHLREDARVLAETLRRLDPSTPVFHLSAAMCPAHRSAVLSKVRSALASGVPCRLVSTQLIEAGVDIDFPALYRAYAGLDSLVQAAGRCNREGRMELGQVYVFQAPTAPPPGVLRQGLETMKVLQAARGTAIELSSPAICDEYFRSFYSMAVSDARGVQAAREQMEYYTVASRFRLIDDGMTTTIIVSYGERAQETIRRMETEGPRRDTFRALQPFSVRVYPQAARRLKEAGAVEELPGRIWYLLAPFAHLYDDDYGLSATGLLVPDASSTII